VVQLEWVTCSNTARVMERARPGVVDIILPVLGLRSDPLIDDRKRVGDRLVHTKPGARPEG